MLVTIALSIQYMTCLEGGVFGRDARRSMSGFFDIAYMHCAMLDSPRYVAIPIVLTVVVLFVLSELSGLVLGPSFKFFQSRHKKHGTGWFDKTHGDQCPRPVQIPMVPWFSLSLTTTAIQLLVSLKVFVGRLDIRHILTAVCKEDSDIVFDLRSHEGWIDFLADGGDGFNSSYSVARMLAQPNLSVRIPSNFKSSQPLGKSMPNLRRAATTKSPASSSLSHSSSVQRRLTNPIMGLGRSGDSLILPRSSVVVHGGDLVYPRPSAQTYRTRLIGPLEAALPAGPPGGSRPRMFLIPGNHDHYDGLESFVRWIVGRTSIGGWKLPQRSSYFALMFREGWWLLGMDVGLTNDLDVFQYQEFCRIIDEQIQDDHRVVVLTHRPQWVMDPYSGITTGDLFHQILDRLGQDRIAMRLAGDLHHYMRFGSSGSVPPLVTSGGGGAFLHPTHVLDSSLVREYLHALKKRKTTGDDENCFSDTEDENNNSDEEISQNMSPKKSCRRRKMSEVVYSKMAEFPSESESRKLAWLNLLKFRDKNWGADIIFGTLYCVMTVSLVPICNASSILSSIENFYWNSNSSWFRTIIFATVEIFFGMILPAFKHVYSDTTFSLFGHILFFCMCYGGAHGKRGNKTHRFMIALTHFIFHAFAAITVVCLVELGVELISRGESPASPFRVPGLIKSLDASLNSHVFEISLNSFLRFMDFPSSLIRNRQPICSSPDHYSREILFRYIWRIIPFIWLLATPTAAKIMGSYLFLSINYLGLHLNESFSSLRIEDYKHFLRMRIDPESKDLHVYVIGVEHVSKDWEQDKAWEPLLFSEVPETPLPPSSKWVTPSCWRGSKAEEPLLVDYFVVPRFHQSR